MGTLEKDLAPWAGLEALAIDYRFPYAVSGPAPFVGYRVLFDRYANSELGVYHAGQTPRFTADFGYDEEHGYRQMAQDLGFNVQACDHMQSASMTTDALFIREYSIGRLQALARWLPKSDIPLTRLVSPLHDVGENASPLVAELAGGVIGDIAHGKKRPHHKVVESKIRSIIFGMFYSDLPESVMARVEAIASHSEDSPAHQTYVWGHDLEAHQTALMAANHALTVLHRGGPYNRRFDRLVKLALQVGQRTCRELIPATARFSYIGDVLNRSEVFFEGFEARLHRG